MSTLTRAAARQAGAITIREHRIPSADSKPYIAVQGPDGALWFCESGASKIGRLDPERGTFTEFALPTPNATPIGITLGGAGDHPVDDGPERREGLPHRVESGAPLR